MDEIDIVTNTIVNTRYFPKNKLLVYIMNIYILINDIFIEFALLGSLLINQHFVRLSPKSLKLAKIRNVASVLVPKDSQEKEF